MLQNIENLIIQACQTFLGKEITVAELQAIYAIYRDLKVITNGQTINQNAQ